MKSVVSFFLPLFLAISPLDGETFWNQHPDVNGWKYVENFGWVYPFRDSGWAYHLNLDYIYSDSGDGGNIWFYRAGDWKWTNLDVYPFMWSNNRGGWLFFNVEERPSADDLAGGLFQFVDSEFWYWDRSYRLLLLWRFDRRIFRIDQFTDYRSNHTGAIEFSYNTDEIIQYLESHPKANGKPYVVLERIGQSEIETVNYFDLSLEEKREIGDALRDINRNYNFRIFYNDTEFP